MPSEAEMTTSRLASLSKSTGDSPERITQCFVYSSCSLTRSRMLHGRSVTHPSGEVTLCNKPSTGKSSAFRHTWTEERPRYCSDQQKEYASHKTAMTPFPA